MSAVESPREARRTGRVWGWIALAVFAAAAGFGCAGWPWAACVALLVWAVCLRQSGYQLGFRDGWRVRDGLPRRNPGQDGGR